MQFTEAVAPRAPGGSGGAAQPGRYLFGRAGDHVQLGGELEGVPLKLKHAAASTAGSRLATVERGAAQGNTVRWSLENLASGDCALAATIVVHRRRKIFIGYTQGCGGTQARAAGQWTLGRGCRTPNTQCAPATPSTTWR